MMKQSMSQNSSDKTAYRELLEDYAHDPVPISNTKSWFDIGLVLMGGVIAIPILLIGFVLGNALSFTELIIAALLGSAIFGLIAIPTAAIGANTRLSTYVLAQYAFGKNGGKLVTIIIALTLFGWFGINLGVFSVALQEVLFSLSVAAPSLFVLTVLSGALMMGTAVFGFKGLHKLSIVAVPLLLALLIVAAYYALSSGNIISMFESSGGVTLGVAISMVVGSMIVGAVITPDFTRYARSKGHGMGAAIFGWVLMLPVLLLLSALAGAATGTADFTGVMYGLGLALPAFIILILASWTTNDNNLYNASLGLSVVFQKYQKWQITLMAGVVGTLLAVLGILSQFTSWLLFLGIFIPPVASIYLADYLLNLNRYQSSNVSDMGGIRAWPLAVWISAAAFGYLATPIQSGGLGLFVFTTVPALDSMIVAFVVYFVGTKFLRIGSI
jgi:cytosine permease